MNHLRRDGLEFIKLDRSVVQSAWKPEAMVDEGLLSSPVTEEHPLDLGEGHM